MKSWTEMVFALAVFNVLAFLLGGSILFERRSVGAGFSVFAGIFLTLTSFSLGLLHWYPTTHRLLQITALAALLLSLVLFCLAAWAVLRRRFSVVFSRDIPTQLVTSGIYGKVRHPFYAAYMLTFVGSALGCAHTMSIVCASAVMALYFVAALLEENRFLRSEFAESYRLYRKRTGMFWPWRSENPPERKDRSL